MRLITGDFIIEKHKTGYRVCCLIQDKEHPMWCEYPIYPTDGYFVFNFGSISEIQKSIKQLRNNNDLLLLDLK